MMLIAETVGLCILFWLLCYLGTGTDEKNIRSYRSYPDAVQKMLMENDKLKHKIRKPGAAAVFASNVVTFSVILLILGLPIRQQGFTANFLNILIMGQVLNAFDLAMDLIWFRNTRRTRFEGTKDQADLYRDPKNHVAAFLRGIAAFLVVSLIDGFILTLF